MALSFESKINGSFAARRFFLELLREITGMNPKASVRNNFRSKLRGNIPSALRDCSTYQFRCAALSELEFQQ
jgi:hypothetical protein